jgi:hypothetical protein
MRTTEFASESSELTVLRRLYDRRLFVPLIGSWTERALGLDASPHSHRVGAAVGSEACLRCSHEGGIDDLDDLLA